MSKLLLLVTLITVVYSWEELAFVLKTIWFKLRRRNKNVFKNSQTDSVVADIVVVATIPLSLTYLLFGPGVLGEKLLILLVELIVLSLVFKGLEEYHWRRRFTAHYEGSDKIVGIMFSVFGLISPSWRFASQAIPRKSYLLKYIPVLIFPITIGLGLVYLVQKFGFDGFQSQLDQLIIIAILGLVINLTIEFLEHMFRSYRLHLFGLIRILIGIVIIFILGKSF